jgi:hypothetical protein
MKFKPLSDEEIAAQRRTLKVGIADFTIGSVKEAISKESGNEMLKLVLKVWDCKGQEGILYDYITFSPKMAWKLKHFLEAIGEGVQYQTGTIDSGNLVGKSGKVMLAIQKDKTGLYGDKVGVKDYMEKVGGAKEDLPNFDVSKEDDGIPF